MHRISRVSIEVSGKYDILIGGGLIAESGKYINECVAPCKALIISDDIVSVLYGEIVERSLSNAGYEVLSFAFQNGEAQKNLRTLSDILEFMGDSGMTRSDVIVALGGGVVGDIAGFAAAVYGRGMRFVQIPTTLLAAVDSSVGGKTAVNLRAAKNMAGVFAQPSLVLTDTDVLRNLPKPLVQDGAAEIVKYGVLSDPSLLELVAAGELTERIDEVVRTCVAIKRDYVLRDEFDEGDRQMLNLGHTIGHAVERCSGYNLTHGHGVAIGLMAIARAAYKLHRSESDLSIPIGRALRAVGLPTESPYPADELLAAAQMDKKRRNASITLVVPLAIGRCALERVPLSELGDWISKGIEGDVL